ncbi:MAG: hypothetical protein ABIW85_09805 [Variovorax sp.]
MNSQARMMRLVVHHPGELTCQFPIEGAFSMRTPIVFSLLFATAAFAADLKPVQEEARAYFDSQAPELASDVNTECGTKYPTIETDFENFEKATVPGVPGTLCSTMTWAVKEACKSAPYKKAVAAKVNGLACLVGAPPAGAKPLDLNKGTLTYYMRTGGLRNDAVKTIKDMMDR